MDGVGLRLLVFLVLFVAAESTWSALRKRRLYDLQDSLANVAISVGNNLIRPLSLAWKYLVFSVIEPFQYYTLPAAPWAFLVTFLIADCAYYWYHRLSHELPVMWTMHHTHHSSPWMNLTTAIRLNWAANFVSPFFFAPFILLGVSPEWLTASLVLGLFYQFFLHTEAVRPLGWLEGKLFNTPSAHRVHHGSNSLYIDRNYAGALIVWDRLFGTYQAEVEPVRYGVTTGFVGHNPFIIQLAPFWKYLQGNWRREKEIDATRRHQPGSVSVR